MERNIELTVRVFFTFDDKNVEDVDNLYLNMPTGKQLQMVELIGEDGLPVDNQQLIEYETLESVEVPSCCRRCGSELKDNRCTDETCPFSDCEQTDDKGWAGHPEHPSQSA